MIRHLSTVYHRAIVVATLTTPLLGCQSCGAPEAAEPSSSANFVRCAMMDAPEARQWRVGALELSVEERRLTVRGTGETAHVLVTRGAAPYAEPLELEGPAVDAAQIVVVLGGLGDDDEIVKASLDALARLGRPVLLLPGARDDPAMWRDAEAEIENREGLVDLAALREVVVAGVSLVPVAGSPHGRYRRSDAVCGWDESVAESLTHDLAPRQPRVLLSWAAPSGSPVSVGIEGGEAGSDLVASLGRALGASSVVAAWPETRAGSVETVEEGIHLVVPAYRGPLAPRGDGSRPNARLFWLHLGPNTVRAEPVASR